MFALAVLACTADDREPSGGDPAGTDTDTPTGDDTAPIALEILTVDVHPPESDDVFLVRQLDVWTSLPARVTATVTGPEGTHTVAFAAESATHRLPLVGLTPETAYSVVVRVEAGAESVTADPIAFDSGGLPAVFPSIAVRAANPGAEPGYWLAPPWSPGVDRVIVVLDGASRPVWAYRPPRDWKAVSATGLGTVVGLEADTIREVDWLGDEVRHLGPDSAEFPLDFGGLHHELLPLADGGFYTFSTEELAVSGYPLAYDLTAFGDATVANHLVRRVSADGTTLETYDLGQLLDPTRIGFNSLDLLLPSNDYDWVHANAIVVDEADDALIVSSRHQDAVFKIDRATGAVRWIFGQPYGWAPEYADLLFTQAEPFQWPGHQHAPQWLPGGRLLLFDNGNNGRRNPYSDANEGDTTSRVAQFTLDETTRTAVLDWEFDEASDGPLYGHALGNADALPTTGNVLATFSYLYTQGGTVNSASGKGEVATRVIEFSTTNGAILRDVELYGDLATQPEGWLVDRMVHLPDLYGTLATVTP
jgi:hypothetical protein